MKRIVLIGLAMALVLAMAVPLAVGATDPTVSITVTAEVVAITNTQDTWAIGTIATSQTAVWGDLATYSTVENTGNVAVDVEIRGTDLTGGTTWSLAADGNPGADIYGLKATITTEYNILVKPSAYVDLKAGLAAAATETWSMTFWSPTSLTAPTDTVQKSGTVTLVASKTA